MKEYNLKHPLYPIPELKKLHDDNNIKYDKNQFDTNYENWYNLVRRDSESGVPKRPIFQKITQIYRVKRGKKEFLIYNEELIGTDHEHNTEVFSHLYGRYKKPSFRRVYDYKTKSVTVTKEGDVEDVYFIPFSKKKLDELYEAIPEGVEPSLIVHTGVRRYGGTGIFTMEEFRDLPFEDLVKIAFTGRGLITNFNPNINREAAESTRPLTDISIAEIKKEEKIILEK